MPAFNVQEKYEGDFSTGEFVSSGLIGVATSQSLWDVGMNKNKVEVDTEGKPVPQMGRLYRGGTKEEARAYQVANGFNANTFVVGSLVTTMPRSSVCNLPDENLAKFQPVIQFGVEVHSGLGKGDDYKSLGKIGYSLVLAPSIVDAYARYQGWYKEPLFPIHLFNNSLENVADLSGVIEQLADARKAIWKALGEDDWKLGKASASKNLVEAVSNGLFSKWTMFIRLHDVYDPSKEAFYQATGGKKAGQQTRQKIAVITEIFSGEREAIAVGKAELDARAEKSATTTSNGTTASIFEKLSEKAKKSYGNTEAWDSIVPDIREELKAQKPMAKVAKDYGVTVEDLGLL
jgi:hypothetical protein